MKPKDAAVAAVVKSRDTLIEQLDVLAVKRDKLDAERTQIEARRRALATELVNARVDEARDKDGAAKLVEELLAERADLDARYTLTMGPGSRINPGATQRTPSGELPSRSRHIHRPTKQARRELSTLYREHVPELLAHASTFVADAETKLAAAIEASAAASSAWRAACAEMAALAKDAGLGNLPAYPVEVRGKLTAPTVQTWPRSTTSPRSTSRSTHTPRIETTCGPSSSAPTSTRSAKPA